jgi:hypothetical protein
MATKLPEELKFIKYYFLSLILTILLSGGAFSYAENIFIICIMLYIIDVHKGSASLAPAETDNNVLIAQ